MSDKMFIKEEEMIMDRREMFLAVNPVFATAKGCLGLLRHTGIKEAAHRRRSQGYI